MNLTSIGDLSTSFLLRQRQSDLKVESQNLQVEVTTGMAANTRRHLGGDYSHLGDIERSLSKLDSYRTTISEADTMASVMQTALGTVQDTMSNLANGLLLAAQSGARQGLETMAADAENAFRSIVGQLNIRAADRSLFGGAAFDQAALSDASDMLSDLRTAVAGETSLSGIQTVLDNWFDGAGGGFETSGYTGSTTDGTPLQLNENVRVGVSIRADDQVFRDALKATVTAALAGDQVLGYPRELQAEMVARAGADLIELQPGMTDIVAGLGLVQSRIEDNKVQNEAASRTLEMSRNALLGVDKYEAASRLQQVQTQIETLYAVTVRASQLSFLNHMR